MNKILPFAKAFFVVDLLFVLYCVLFQDMMWLLNTQVAFLGSLFVTIASFLSYKKNVDNRVSNLDLSKQLKGENRDKIDEIDDPFDLYSQNEEIPEDQLTTEKIKEIIQEERSKVKRESFKNTIFSMGGFVSIYRILGYATLVFGFFALNNNKMLLPIPFLLGLAIVPLSVLASKFILKSKEDQ